MHRAIPRCSLDGVLGAATATRVQPSFGFVVSSLYSSGIKRTIQLHSQMHGSDELQTAVQAWRNTGSSSTRMSGKDARVWPNRAVLYQRVRKQSQLGANAVVRIRSHYTGRLQTRAGR